MRRGGEKNSVIRVLCFLAVLWLAMAYVFCNLGNLFPEIEIHGHYVYAYFLRSMNPNGIAADFLFLMLGVLLYEDVVSEKTWMMFLIEKAKKIMPMLVIIILTGWFLSFIGVMRHTYLYDVLALFGLNNIGWTAGENANFALWIVSSGFIAVLLLFLLCKDRIANEKFQLPILLIVILGYGFIVNNNCGMLDGTYETFGNINAGLLRALSGMSFGLFLKHMSLALKDKIRPTRYAWIENLGLLLFGGIIVFLITFDYIPIATDMSLIVLFAIFLLGVLLKQEQIEPVLKKFKVDYLGNLTYPLLVSYALTTNLISTFIWKTKPRFVEENPVLNVVLVIVSFIFSSCILFGLVSKEDSVQENMMHKE